jgi:hypothetical protein
VEAIKATRHSLMIGGSVLVVGGVVLWYTWGLATSFLAILGGVVALAAGSLGRTAGYQVRAHNLPKREEALWRLEAWGSVRFVERLRSSIGGRTGF